MNYEEFKDAVIEKIEAEVRRLNPNFEIEQHPVVKNNNVVLDGITINDGSELVPTFHADDLYMRYQNDESMDDIVSSMIDMMQAHSLEGNVTAEHLSDWNAVKDHVVMHVIGAEANQDRAQDFPTRPMEDMLLAYRIVIDINDEGMGSTQITNEMQDVYGVSEEQLYQAALENTPRIMPTLFCTMEAMIFELEFDQQMEDKDLDQMLTDIDKDSKMYILTNKFKSLGAAALFCPEVMDKVAQAFDSNMIVLPSSVHETILAPQWDGMEIEIEDFKQMVKEINETQAVPEERLTNQVYVYDKDDKKLMIADKWQEQKLTKIVPPKRSIRDSLKKKKEQIDKPETPIKKARSNEMEK